LKKITLLDDDIDLVGPKERYQYVEKDSSVYLTKQRNSTVYCSPSVLAASFVEDCEPYYTLEYRSSGITIEIIRSYTKVIDVLGNVGGIFEIFSFAGLLIYCFWKDKMFKHYLHSKLIHHDMKEFAKYFPNAKCREIEKMLDQLVEQQMDATTIIRKINEFSFILRGSIKPYHKALIPLASALEKKNSEEFGQDVSTRLDLFGNLENLTIQKSYAQLKKSVESSRKDKTSANNIENQFDLDAELLKIIEPIMQVKVFEQTNLRIESKSVNKKAPSPMYPFKLENDAQTNSIHEEASPNMPSLSIISRFSPFSSRDKIKPSLRPQKKF